MYMLFTKSLSTLADNDFVYVVSLLLVSLLSTGLGLLIGGFILVLL
jgi:hypothetical protein